MSYPNFQAEVLRLVQMTDPKVTEIEPKTSLAGLDSLACVELIQCAEEELKVELTFEEVRKCQTFYDLGDVLEEKGYGGQ